MGKANAKKKNKNRRVSAGGGNIHPLIQQAASNGARLDRGVYEVASVGNPYGEVMVRGEIRRHKAVRKVPHFETLYRSKVIDRTVFVCLEWYADRFGLAQSGMFKCGLDVSGSGGGSAFTHIPTTQAAMEARSDVDWARGFIPNDLLPVFDGVMEGEDSFTTLGARLYPDHAPAYARTKASSAFKIAANYLLLGIGSRICLATAA